MFHLTHKTGDSKISGGNLYIWHKGAWALVAETELDGAFVRLLDKTVYALCEDGTYR